MVRCKTGSCCWFQQFAKQLYVIISRNRCLFTKSFLSLMLYFIFFLSKLCHTLVSVALEKSFHNEPKVKLTFLYLHIRKSKSSSGHGNNSSGRDLVETHNFLVSKICMILYFFYIVWIVLYNSHFKLWFYNKNFEGLFSKVCFSKRVGFR